MTRPRSHIWETETEKEANQERKGKEPSEREREKERERENSAVGCYDNKHRQAVKQIDQLSTGIIEIVQSRVAAILQAPIGQHPMKPLKERSPLGCAAKSSCVGKGRGPQGLTKQKFLQRLVSKQEFVEADHLWQLCERGVRCSQCKVKLYFSTSWPLLRRGASTECARRLRGDLPEQSNSGGAAAVEHEPDLIKVSELNAARGPELVSEVVQAVSLKSAPENVCLGDTKPKLGEPRWLNLSVERAALVASLMEQAQAFPRTELGTHLFAFGPASVSCARCKDSITYKASEADLVTFVQSSTCIAIGNFACPEVHASHKLFQYGSKRRCVMRGSVLARAGDAWKETTMLRNPCLQRVPGRPTDQADARRLLQQVRAWMNPSQSLTAMFSRSPT